MKSIIDIPGLLAHKCLLDDHDQSLSSLSITQFQGQLVRHILDVLQ